MDFKVFAVAAFAVAACQLPTRAAEAPAEAPHVAAGRLVAQRSCGGCHAIGTGDSPLADAPPFRDLHRRYPPGGLDQILQEGMLASDRPLEEGRRPGHPRMPMVVLDPDEVTNLKAFLHSLEPR